MRTNFVKPYLGPRDLLNLFKGRGLLIPDDSEVYDALIRMGYYRLTGYCQPLQKIHSLNPHDFIEGTQFADIMTLYHLDTEIRGLMSEALEKLEIALRTSICESMCSQYGTHWYMVASSFEVGKHEAIFTEAAKSVDFNLEQNRHYKQDEPEKKSRSLFLDHYYDNYNNPLMPVAWMLRELASFGFWARTYQALKEQDQKQITQYWKNPDGKKLNHELLGSWLWSISILRNRCAHHSRIINRRFPYPPKLPDNASSKQLFYSKTDDLRTLLVIVSILCASADPQYQFNKKLLQIVKKYGSKVDLEKSLGLGLERKETWEDTIFWKDRT
jgi:abortive infection bacteriophage resistance protein